MTAVDDLAAEALFASYLQPSQSPSGEVVEAEVMRTVKRYGSEGCAASVALEFGDHPETAVLRMAWVRTTLTTADPRIRALHEALTRT